MSGGCNKDLVSLRDQVTANLQQTIKDFRTGADQHGYQRLITILESLEELVLLVTKAENTGAIGDLSSSFSQTLQAMQQGDPVMLADCLEYQVLPTIAALY